MNKQQIEKWIEAYEDCVLVNRQGGDDPAFVLYAGDLRDLLKTHAIVPRVPTDKMVDALYPSSGRTTPRATFKAMIEASEELK